VKEVLTRPQRVENYGDVTEEHAEDLKPLGDAALPLLADHLNNWTGTGWFALWTMLKLDSNKAAPIIFAKLPGGTIENVQAGAFKFYTNRALKGEKLTFAADMHSAALRVVGPGGHRKAMVEAIYAIGVTGNRDDFALLESFYEKYQNEPRTWTGRVQDAACAALARLGNQKYLNILQDKLKRPSPSEPTPDDAAQLTDIIDQAGFAGNRILVPFLCPHLYDRSVPERFYIQPGAMDVVIPASSAAAAADALGQIIDHKLPREDYSETALIKWKTWCKQHVHTNTAEQDAAANP